MLESTTAEARASIPNSHNQTARKVVLCKGSTFIPGATASMTVIIRYTKAHHHQKSSPKKQSFIARPVEALRETHLGRYPSQVFSAPCGL